MLERVKDRVLVDSRKTTSEEARGLRDLGGGQFRHYAVYMRGGVATLYDRVRQRGAGRLDSRRLRASVYSEVYTM